MQDVTQSFTLTGKTIVITGATGVLGEAFVKGVTDMGGRAVLIGRNTNVGEERVSQLAATGKDAFFVKADVLSKEELIHAHDTILT